MGSPGFVRDSSSLQCGKRSLSSRLGKQVGPGAVSMVMGIPKAGAPVLSSERGEHLSAEQGVLSSFEAKGIQF